MKIRKRFFTSDIHFDDDRLNLYGRDLLFKNADEYNDHVISVWNEVVGKNDLVIVIGDVSMTKKGLKLLTKLNGEKWLVKGNYDVSQDKGGTAKYDISDEVLLKYFTEVVDDMELTIGDETVYLNHYPTNARPEMFNIVGHIHGTWKVQRNMVNVGLDAWHFTPVSEDLIKFQMNGIRQHYDQNVFAGELIANTSRRTGEVKIIRAPERYGTVNVQGDEDVYVFLAGPIQGAPEWQEEMMDKILSMLSKIKFSKNIILCSPRRLELDDANFDYDEQVNWESHYLDMAGKWGVIAFWLPNETERVDGRSFAQTSRFEIGEWWAKGQSIPEFNVVVGAEDGFSGIEYIKKKFEEAYPDFILNDSIDGMVEEIIMKVSKRL